LVEAHFGHFETRTKKRRLVTPIKGVPRDVEVYHVEEKGSDVNLATWLLLDGMDGVWEEAVVISNDSDLEEPIKQANTRFGPVHVASPHQLTKQAPYTYIYSIAKVSTSYNSLDSNMVAACQLPDPVVLPSGKKVSRPAEWK
jgi:hypothetical protein